ncbi:MAG: hypothetical protein ACUVX9_10775 [Anaerolineae bacterium]
MKRKLIAIGITALVVGALALTATFTVLAQDPTPTQTPTPQCWPGRGPSYGARLGRPFAGVRDVVTELLGMTPEEIRAERQKGKTLAQIAEEKGVSEQEIIDAVVAEMKATLDQAVKNGKLTQAQADWLLARTKALVPFTLSNPFVPPENGFGRPCRGFRGWGRFGGKCPNGNGGNSQ